MATSGGELLAAYGENFVAIDSARRTFHARTVRELRWSA